MAGMPGRSGGPRAGAGRPKGVPNKVPNDVKALVLAALDKAGGADYLRDRAFDQPVAFMGLVGKVLPLQVTGKDGVPLQVDFRWSDAPTSSGIVSSATNMVASVTIEAERPDTAGPFASDAEPDLIEWATPELSND